jgi:hypothetical protein
LTQLGVERRANGRTLVDELAKLFDQLAGREAAVAPVTLKRAIDKCAPQFAGYEQHDGQELLSFLLEAIHVELNRAMPAMETSPAPVVTVDSRETGGHSRQYGGQRRLRTGRKGRRVKPGKNAPQADEPYALPQEELGESGPRFIDGKLRSDMSEDDTSMSEASESSASTRSARSHKGQPYKVVTSGLGRPGLEELAELEEVEDSDQDSVGGRRRRGPLAFFQALSPKQRRRKREKKEKEAARQASAANAANAAAAASGGDPRSPAEVATPATTVQGAQVAPTAKLRDPRCIVHVSRVA